MKPSPRCFDWYSKASTIVTVFVYLSREMTYAPKEKESTMPESLSNILEDTKWRSARLTMRTCFIFKEGDMTSFLVAVLANSSSQD